jgi:site-specific DNA recombinase
VGVITLRDGQTFAGIHQPLVGKVLFDRVQDILSGRSTGRGRRHTFVFRRTLTCNRCGYSLVGERKKSYVYYRCHSPSCRGTSIREESADIAVRAALGSIYLSDAELSTLRALLLVLHQDWEAESTERQRLLNADLAKTEARLTRLTDAYLDHALEKDAFDQRRRQLLLKQADIKEQLQTTASPLVECEQILELAKSAHFLYNSDDIDEKRESLQMFTSNAVVDVKDVVFTLRSQFAALDDPSRGSNGGPFRNGNRTPAEKAKSLWEWVRSNPGSLDTIRPQYARRMNHDKEEDVAA